MMSALCQERTWHCQNNRANLYNDLILQVHAFVQHYNCHGHPQLVGLEARKFPGPAVQTLRKISSRVVQTKVAFKLTGNRIRLSLPDCTGTKDRRPDIMRSRHRCRPRNTGLILPNPESEPHVLANLTTPSSKKPLRAPGKRSGAPGASFSIARRFIGSTWPKRA